MQLIESVGESIQNCDVLLINPPYPRRFGGGLVPPIGLCYLAAVLRRTGARPAIVDLALWLPTYELQDASDLEGLVEHLLKECSPDSPKLIGIGPLVTASLHSTQTIVKACRRHCSATVVVGGPLCSVPGFSKVAKSYLDVDAFVAGDGETPIAAIWHAVDGRTGLESVNPRIAIPGMMEMEPFREPNLNLLPVPARDLLQHDGYQSSRRRSFNLSRMTAAFLSRGCPYSCSFCAAPLSSGKVVRKLSTHRITEEVAACGSAGFQTIIFYDDCLFIKSPKLESSVLEFVEAVNRSGWKGTFQLELRCDAVASLSRGALFALADAGCRQVNMGIEKAHTVQLQRLRKRLSPDIAREAVDIIAATNMRAAGTFILGGPGETRDDIEATIDFAVSMPLDFAHFNPMALYPGTSLFEQVFGPSASASWLELCLDREIAPKGDILWSDSEIRLDYIIESIKNGYSQFYTNGRLGRVLTKHDESESEGIRMSYEILARDRADSWTSGSPLGQVDSRGGLISC